MYATYGSKLYQKKNDTNLAGLFCLFGYITDLVVCCKNNNSTDTDNITYANNTTNIANSISRCICKP